MTIQAIISSTIKRLKSEGKQLTPDFYTEAFCKEAAKAGMQVEDCQHVEKFTQTLNPEFQKELSNYRIKSLSELVRFLISKLNRTNSSQCNDLLDSQTQMTKRILQVIEVLHNYDATQLALQSIRLLESDPKPQQIDEFRQRWINFITTYDDTFLQKLSPYGRVDTENLQKTITNLELQKIETSSYSKDSLLRVAELLVASFVPSIASKVDETIATLSNKIRTNPEVLNEQNIKAEIKSVIALRIALDKKSVKLMIKSIDGVLDKLSLRLIDMIERSDASTQEIKDIKRELERFNHESQTDFRTAHKKLYTVAVALEENTKLLSLDLRKHSSEVELLSARVKTLEEELEAAKKESKEDFLTKLYNKRALDEFMAIKEAEFDRYGSDYTIVMFDLDYFKNINDTFGHEAGDAVLKAFAKILQKECRSVDVVGRYGGEEFMALLSQTDLNGGFVFAQKVRHHVEASRFLYKGKRMSVTVSCGVAERKKNISLKETINAADSSLYRAKKDGRNRVELQK